VETKDVVVSVVGTVFLVSVEEIGSRVIVIEGQVHVDQGGVSKNLLAGQQLVTNPQMELVTLGRRKTRKATGDRSNGAGPTAAATSGIAYCRTSASVRSRHGQTEQQRQR
jgi:hypothetical protein